MHQALDVGPKRAGGAGVAFHKETQDGDQTVHHPLEFALVRHSAIGFDLLCQIDQRVFRRLRPTTQEGGDLELVPRIDSFRRGRLDCAARATTTYRQAMVCNGSDINGLLR
jgi:hypothetical protein